MRHSRSAFHLTSQNITHTRETHTQHCTALPNGKQWQPKTVRCKENKCTAVTKAVTKARMCKPHDYSPYVK